jgi:hypothetical protein
MLTIEPHPLLDLYAFITRFSGPIGSLASPSELLGFFEPEPSIEVPFASSDSIRKDVRDLLRHGGFKPTGRNKPASEYLIKAVDQRLLTSINVAVDSCNAVSLHSGLPISVVDADKVKEPLSVGVAPEGSEYVFNATGQVLKLDGLLCLFDSEGPCANAVKDSQRTKTSESTTRTLSLIWGTNALPDRSEKVGGWYQQLLLDCGAVSVSRVSVGG